jgi:CTP synthase (UTP-ammonia lyase)
LVRTVVVSVLIDSPPDHRYHLATLAALRHAADHRGIPIEVRVVPTDTIREPSTIASAGSAVIIGPGTPYRDPEAAHAVVREARERNIPLVGT